MLDKKYIGSNFDDFLKEQGILDESEELATKRVVAFQIEQEMIAAGITKSELARRMSSSRSAVDRLLDPVNHSVTLSTLEKAARAVGKQLIVKLSA